MSGGATAGGGALFRGRCLDPGTLGFGVPFRRYVATAAAAGFDMVEVPLGVARTLRQVTVAGILAEHAVTAAVYSCPWELPANGSVSRPRFARRLAAMPPLLDTVAAAGGRIVSAFFAGDRPGMVRLGHDELVDRCAALVALARTAGLAVCVELNDVDRLRHAGRVVREVSGLRLLVDTFHYFRAGLTAAWFSTLPPDSVGWVHLSDVPHGATPTTDGGPRAWPGAGSQDLRSITTGLAGTGYTGSLSLEVLPEPPAGTDLVRYAKALLVQTQAALDAVGAAWVPARSTAPVATAPTERHPQENE